MQAYTLLPRWNCGLFFFSGTEWERESTHMYYLQYITTVWCKIQWAGIYRNLNSSQFWSLCMLHIVTFSSPEVLLLLTLNKTAEAMKGKLSFMSGPRYKPRGYIPLSVHGFNASGGITDSPVRESHITIKNRSQEWESWLLRYLLLIALSLNHTPHFIPWRFSCQIFNQLNSCANILFISTCNCVLYTEEMFYEVKCNTVCVHSQPLV